MEVPWALFSAKFVDRPNRFLTRFEIDGEIRTAHLPDPGRLKELLLPGVELLVQHNPGPKRKTDYTTHMVKHKGLWVCINTMLPNQFVEFLVKKKALPFLQKWAFVRREVKLDHSRFDFLLNDGRRELYLEVKSVTYAENGIAQFPDAVSERAARHARHLAQISKEGVATTILFVIQRDDATLFTPMWDRDPDVGQALNEAFDAGVAIHAIKTHVTPKRFTYSGEVPIDLTPPKHVSGPDRDPQ